MKLKRKEIIGLLVLIIALLCSLSIFGYDPTEQPGGLLKGETPNSFLGYFGIYVSYYQYKWLGYSSLSLPMILFIAGYILFTNKIFKDYYKIFITIFLLSLWTSTFTALVSFEKYAGLIGNSLNIFLVDIFGNFGSPLIMFVGLISLCAFIFNISIYHILIKVSIPIKNIVEKIYSKISSISFISFRNRKETIEIKKAEEEIIETKQSETISEEEEVLNNNKDDSHQEDDSSEQIIDIDENELDISDTSPQLDNLNNNDESNVVIEEEEDILQGNLDAEKDRKNKYLQYKLPELNYLSDPIDIRSHDEDILKQKAEELKYALDSFGVTGNVVKISPGPVITLFEIEPADGVRVNKFTNLSEDLSRIMGGKRVRIIAPIPGSKSVGIELPNETPSTVYMKSIINSKVFIENKSKLKIALGKTTTGDAFIFELDKMPHLLVAGATGSGKSVCINTIIVSLLYNAKPDEVKFILMDPKKVELSAFKSLIGYHLMTAINIDEYVMTTAKNAVAILNSAISEMERRFQLFSDVRVRNIQEYNIKKKEDSSLESIPFLVVIIDELADLMMTSGRAIEDPITRLAQKARAVGLHLIVATQRPSVDVITGLIKSNFPARISFQVSSKIDSRTIIDQMGAEKLLGKGDMLFLLPGTASPIRIHNAFITLEEIESILSHISTQPKPDEEKLPEIKKIEKTTEFDISADQDEYLKDAAKLVIDNQQASVSLLQRRFRIGYSRAGRLIDELESLGIISGYSGSKAREVLVDESYLNEIFDKE